MHGGKRAGEAMKLASTSYATLVFDCDGVVLNSNKVKTKAFYQAALPYGKDAAEAMVDYHVAHGGISRYKKFAYFVERIVPDIAPRANGPDLDTLLMRYADEVRQGLLTCEVAEGLSLLRKQTLNARWLIVSGGDQAELRDVFKRRGLADMFDGGIFGSPDAKEVILEREIAKSNIQFPALFIGDSKYDHQAASQAGLDFLFLTNWTEVNNHHDWCAREKLSFCCKLNDLL